MRILLSMLTVLVLGGCATWGPTWSAVSGYRYHKTIENRYPGIINMVGDQGVTRASYRQPFKTAPGTYDIVVQSPPHGHFGGSTKTMRLTLEPCKIYYINAQFADWVRPEWEPVVDYVESIAGCTTTPLAQS